MLACSSWTVLRADKKLLFFPAISGAVTVSLIVAASLVAASNMTGVDSLADSLADFVLLVLTYFAVPYFLLLAYITNFFNAALISAANERFQGGDPTIRSALRGAVRRAWKIVPWTFLSTLAIFYRLTEKRVRWIRRFVVATFGMAWTVIAFLALPVIVVEGLGANKAITKSGKLIDATWGDNMTGHVGLGIVGFLLFIPTVVLLAVAGTTSPGIRVAVAAAAVGVLWGILVVIVITALTSIYQTALYHFAADGDIPSEYFNDRAIRSAFYRVGYYDVVRGRSL